MNNILSTTLDHPASRVLTMSGTAFVLNAAMVRGRRLLAVSCDITLAEDVNLSEMGSTLVGCRISIGGHRLIGGTLSHCAIEL